MHVEHCMCNTAYKPVQHTTQHIKLYTHILHPHPYTQYAQTSLHGETHQRCSLHNHIAYMHKHPICPCMYIQSCLLTYPFMSHPFPITCTVHPLYTRNLTIHVHHPHSYAVVHISLRVVYSTVGTLICVQV